MGDISLNILPSDPEGNRPFVAEQIILLFSGMLLGKDRDVAAEDVDRSTARFPKPFVAQLRAPGREVRSLFDNVPDVTNERRQRLTEGWLPARNDCYFASANRSLL